MDTKTDAATSSRLEEEDRELAELQRTFEELTGLDKECVGVGTRKERSVLIMVFVFVPARRKGARINNGVMRVWPKRTVSTPAIRSDARHGAAARCKSAM